MSDERAREIVKAAAADPDGVSGRALVNGLTNAGFTPRDASYAVICAINRGDLVLGDGLRLFAASRILEEGNNGK